MKLLLNKYRNELILLFLLLAAALAILWGQYLHRSRIPAVQARVSSDGVLVETIDLLADGEYTIRSAGGGTNHLIVEKGQIWCDEASCPDKVCVRQGKQSLEGSTIVCLPNRMIVEIIGGE